ncbi:MAG: helix-turn-helix transcriptional regulator [Symploca sp. SIO3E6]|nr:helix-turn-helix transcriptional regulator [Caldora sp. SIO3E6]
MNLTIYLEMLRSKKAWQLTKYCWISKKERTKGKNLMAQRNRNTVGVDVEGALIIRDKIADKGWTLRHLSDFTQLSLSTINRFLRGKFVEWSNFKEILKVLELELEDKYITKKIDTLNSPRRTNGKVTRPTLQLGIFMSGTFTEDKRPQIERTLRHLQKLLIGCKINLRDDQGVVTVSGDFSEDKRLHIEATISELEDLFTSIEVTW